MDIKVCSVACDDSASLFGTDFGPVPMSPKLHIDLVDETITDAADRKKIFSTNAFGLLRLQHAATALVAGV